MKLQDQCCTWEQGQRLVELGVKADATFWWMPAKSGTHGEYIQYGYHGDNISPAFNVAELGELLPATLFLKHKSSDPPWEVTRIAGNGPNYWHAEDTLDSIGPWPTEAQARAQLLIHLLENNLMS
jgi:hypothetical protein